MSFIHLQSLILVEIGIDIAIVALIIFLFRKSKKPEKDQSLDKEIKIFESLIADASKAATEFEEQLAGKHRVIKGLNEELDKRVNSLNLLLNRADLLLSSHAKKVGESNGKHAFLKKREKEILMLAGEGHKIEEIASKLSIPKEEVRLVLDLKKRFLRTSPDKGVSC